MPAITPCMPRNGLAGTPKTARSVPDHTCERKLYVATRARRDYACDPVFQSNRMA
jgi:hypothetical protein